MTDAALIRYDAACRALATARTTDDAKKIRNHSEAVRAYARQAKNRQLEVDAAEIRIRAERRLGELLAEQRATVGLNPGTRAKGGDRRASGGRMQRPPENVPTLADAGIDKDLSARSQRLAKIPARKFEALVSEWRDQAEQKAARVSTQLMRTRPISQPTRAATEPDGSSTAPTFGVFADDDIAERVQAALRPAYELFEDWPHGQSLSLFIQATQQLLKRLERLEAKTA